MHSSFPYNDDRFPPGDTKWHELKCFLMEGIYIFIPLSNVTTWFALANGRPVDVTHHTSKQKSEKSSGSRVKTLIKDRATGS